MLILGVVLSVPACLLAAFAPTIEVLVFARIFGGMSAGMAYPTTLALITALWSGPARTRSIALWSALGGAIAALGPLISGLPARALRVELGLPRDPAAGRRRPGHGHRASCPPTSTRPTEPVDNLGGVLSAVLVGSAILAINFLPVPGERVLAVGLIVIAIVAGDRRSSSASSAPPSPLYDLKIAGAAGLLGRGLRRDHRVRLADGRDVHRPAVPAERARLLDARRRARRSSRRPWRWSSSPRARPSWSRRAAPGSRCCSATSSCLLGFVTMFLLWNEGIDYWPVALGYALVGHRRRLRRHAGVALAHRLRAGQPGRHGVGHGRPAARPRRRVHAVDLRRAADRRLCRGRRRRRWPATRTPTRSRAASRRS